MKRRSFIGGLIVALFFAWPVFPGNIIRFTPYPATISFPSQDPDLFPEIAALSELALDIHANQFDPQEPWSIEIMAADDLISGSDRIPIDSLSWQVTGSLSSPSYTLQNGRLSRGVYVQIANGLGGDPRKVLRGSLNITFYLRNLWPNPTGNYSQQITLRMTVQGDVQYANFTITYASQVLVKLELPVTSIGFPDANPDVLALIPAAENPTPLTVKARVSTFQPVYLHFQATGDLVAGGNTIPIGRVAWTAGGGGFVSGTMSRVSPQPAGNWTGPGERAGSFEYWLTNSWSYNVGGYTASITITVSTI